ncbi:MAG: ribosome maturation factor RimP [bacterium]|nr:ribosome maturation factor RimP [bacterium]MDE0351948.1 ribosome maturation factor RimP [bacterium]
MSIEERLGDLFEQHLSGQGLELDYLQVAGRGPRIVRVIVDSEGGVGVDQLAAVSRSLSRQLDRLDPFEGSYSLEVSSPGLERTLHLPRHFRKSIGRDVIIKTNVDIAGSRHHRGVLEAADSDGCSVQVDGESRLIGYGQIRSARTRFEWKRQARATRKSG